MCTINHPSLRYTALFDTLVAQNVTAPKEASELCHGLLCVQFLHPPFQWLHMTCFNNFYQAVRKFQILSLTCKYLGDGNGLSR